MEDKPEIKIKTNFAALLALLEEKRGERYSNNALSRKLPIAYHQVKKLKSDTLTRIDLRTLQKILNFFNREGLEVTPANLFVYK